MAAQLSLGALTAGAILHLLLQHSRRSRGPACDKDQQNAAVSAEAAGQQEAGAEEAQQAVEQLRTAYATMAARFEASGLDLAGIAEVAAWFYAGPPAAWPRRYSSFTPQPLQPAAVRLLIVPLAACCPRVASLGSTIAADLLGRLPPGCKTFSNGRQNLHITVFHFSHPADPRPDSLQHHSGLEHLLPQPQQQQQQQQQQQEAAGKEPAKPAAAAAAASQHVYNLTASSASHSEAAAAATGGSSSSSGICDSSKCSAEQREQQQQHQQAAPRKLDPAVLPPPHARPGPTPAQLEAEQALAAAVLAGAAGPITLQMERVLLAASGVLLLTWSDPSGRLGQLRQQLLAHFPGACSRQSNIIHTSLFRIVATPPAAGTAAAAAAGCCRQGGGGSLLDDMLVSPEAAAAGTGAAAGWVAGSSSCSGGGVMEPGVQLSRQDIAAISEACEQWTAKVSGQQLQVGQLWWLSEEEFSTVEGPRVPMALGSA